MAENKNTPTDTEKELLADDTLSDKELINLGLKITEEEK